MATKALRNSPNYARIVALYRACFLLSRQHSALVAESEKLYGDHGPLISGIAREHFPEPVKRALRSLCAQMNDAADEGDKLRPHGVRVSSMHTLYHELKMKDGSGFYH